MPLQSSGALSINQIRVELGSGSYSLRTLSAAAGKSTPDAISEFYGYSAAPQYYAYTVEVLTCYIGSCYSSSYSPPNGYLVSADSLDIGRYYPDASSYIFNITSYVGYGNYTGHVFNQVGPSSTVCWAVCDALGW